MVYDASLSSPAGIALAVGAIVGGGGMSGGMMATTWFGAIFAVGYGL